MDKIKIPFHNIYLKSDDRDTSKDIPSVRFIKAYDLRTDSELFYIEIDERFYNTFTCSIWYSDNYYNEINYIKTNFDKFKKTDISYGTSYYLGSKPLMTDEYLNYLKSEIRNESINKLLENE